MTKTIVRAVNDVIMDFCPDALLPMRNKDTLSVL